VQRWSLLALTVQGKPVVRRGRKARDLLAGDRPAAGNAASSWCTEGYVMSKARLRLEAMRVLLALVSLASIVIALGSARKW
jgi:hypothetical protein